MDRDGDYLGCDLRGAHLRLEIVGCNFWRGNDDTILPSVRSFDAAVEEVGDVRVLLSFRNPQLFFPGSGAPNSSVAGSHCHQDEQSEAD